MKKFFLAILLVAIFVGNCFAVLPNSTTYIDIKNSHKYEKVVVPIESTSPTEVHFLINLFDRTKGIYPLYTQVSCYDPLPSSTFYLISLKNLYTGSYVFKDVKTTSGRYATYRARSEVRKEHSYILTVAVPASTTYRSWIPPFKTAYKPRLRVDVGVWNQGVVYDGEFTDK